MLEHFEGHLRRRSERSKLYYEFPALEEISTPEQFRKCPVCCGDILGSSELDASCSFKQKLMHHLAKHPTIQLSRYGLHQALLKDDYGGALHAWLRATPEPSVLCADAQALPSLSSCELEPRASRNLPISVPDFHEVQP